MRDPRMTRGSRHQAAGRANSLQREAVYAAERSAAGAEKSARYAMFAALAALATVVASIIPACIDRLR